MKVKIPARRTQKVQERFEFLDSIEVGCCKSIHSDDFPEYRHAVEAYNQEKGRRISVRTNKDSVSFWRIK